MLQVLSERRYLESIYGLWEISKEHNCKIISIKLQGGSYEVEINIANNQTSTILCSLRPILMREKIVYIISLEVPLMISSNKRPFHRIRGYGCMQEPLNGMYKLEKTCIIERWAEILGYTLARTN
jgi:hypothetical protein